MRRIANLTAFRDKAECWQWAPKTLRTTPAMAANVTKRLWEIGDIVDVLEAWEAAKWGAPYLGEKPWNGLAGKHR
jgi:hypothetical protein